MPTIAPAALAKLLETEPNLALLDVRSPGEFTAVHVPQARNIPLDQLDPALLDKRGIIPGQPLYLLCQGGGRATRAAELLSRAGYSQATVVEGGTAAWEKAGLPVTRGEGGVISLERQIRIAAGLLVTVGIALSLWVDPAFIFLAAFVGVGLIFSGVTDWCGLGLLLAKLPWNRRSSCGCEN